MLYYYIYCSLPASLSPLYKQHLAEPAATVGGPDAAVKCFRYVYESPRHILVCVVINWSHMKAAIMDKCASESPL